MSDRNIKSTHKGETELAPLFGPFSDKNSQILGNWRFVNCPE